MATIDPHPLKNERSQQKVRNRKCVRYWASYNLSFRTIIVYLIYRMYTVNKMDSSVGFASYTKYLYFMKVCWSF